MRKSNPISRRMRDERGQVIVFVVIAFVFLTGMIGIVIDIGYAYKTQRDLQSAADAAALAGAQQLPDSTAATATATQYGASRSGGNKMTRATVTESVTTACISTIPGCNPVNSVAVSETADVPTFFAKIFGLNSFKVHVKATACSPCGSKPVDVMLVVDRTGSMCQNSAGQADPSCTDLNNARAGVRTFLSFFDPNSRLRRARRPPTRDERQQPLRDSGHRELQLGERGIHDRADVERLQERRRHAQQLLEPPPDAQLHPGRRQHLVLERDRGRAGGARRTRSAQRPGRDRVHVGRRSEHRPDLLRDHLAVPDAALPPGRSPPRTSRRRRARPSTRSATRPTTTPAAAGRTPAAVESPAITIDQALSGIASNPSNYFKTPTPGSLKGIYTAIAQDISHGSSSLIG